MARRLLTGVSTAVAIAFAAPHASAQSNDGAEAPKAADVVDEAPRRTQATPSGSRSEQAPGEVGTAESAAPSADLGAPVPAGENGTSPKRAVPDYDGRGDPKTSAGDVALWVPRVIFSPIYFVTEFVIRRPLGWLISTAERKQWPSAIRNFFLFGPEKKAGIVPTAFLDFGFRASVGIYAFWDDLFGPGNHLRLHATTLGPDWLQGAIADRIPVGKDSTLDLRVEGVHRPDQVFHGLGPSTLQRDRVRYGIDMFQARPVFELTWWKQSRITTEAGFRLVGFRDDACCENASLSSEIRAGRMAAPPGYEDGFTALYQRAEVTVDTRDPRPADQTGVRVELEVQHESNMRQSRSNWVRYGGTVGGYVDIHNNRTLSLAVTTLFVDPMSSGAEIPFTEQIVLGGSGPMRGYLYGRLIDRSAAIGTVKYRWPIWVFLDGTLQVAMGNVFGPQLDDFKAKLLRMSAAMGVESVGNADHTFEFLVGLGTETIDRGFQVNAFRLLFGTNRGF